MWWGAVVVRGGRVAGGQNGQDGEWEGDGRATWGESVAELGLWAGGDARATAVASTPCVSKVYISVVLPLLVSCGTGSEACVCGGDGPLHPNGVPPRSASQKAHGEEAGGSTLRTLWPRQRPAPPSFNRELLTEQSSPGPQTCPTRHSPPFVPGLRTTAPRTPTPRTPTSPTRIYSRTARLSGVPQAWVRPPA